MKLFLPSLLRSGRSAGLFLLGVISLFVLAEPAGAQDITKTVAPNIGNSDNFVDIKNNSGDRWEFFSAPTPSPARMARVSANSVAVDAWPSVPNFAPDAAHESQNRIYAGEYLRVYPGSLAANTVITIPFTYGVAANTHYNFKIIVTNGAQVTSITLLDPNPTTASLVHWKVNFDVPVSGVTAANFEFNNPALITSLSFASVTADGAQPSTSWTVAANTGSGNGLLGLNWLQHVSESPIVPNSFTGYQYDFQFAPVINKDPVGKTIDRNTTATLTIDATLRGGGSPNYQWYSGTSVTPNLATAISGATSASYTPANFTSTGSFSYFCRVTTTPGNYTDSAPAVITVVDPPKITTSPASQTVYIGQTATLQVAATGSNLHYQWYAGPGGNESFPVGPDSATFVTPVLSTDASYWVKVSNGGPTTAVSSAASLTVTEKPSLVVTVATDTLNNRDTQTSLREALAYAATLGGPQTVTFAPALAGQTILLTTGATSVADPSALVITGNVILQGGTTSPGVTLSLAQGVQKRHFYVASGASLTLNNLTLTNGYASDYGGSIWSQGSLTVRGCAFSGNTAGSEGGAIQCWGDSALAVIENSTFSGNTSLGIAGAFDAGAQQMTIRNITAVHNTAAANGSAITFYKNSPLFVNNLVAANTNDGINLAASAVLSAQSTNNITGTGGTGGLVNGSNGNLTGVPEANLYLGALGDHGGPTPTVSLLPASPAINSGATLATLTSDQRGYSRGPLTNGLLGRYYNISSTPNANIISPLSNLEGFPVVATVLTPRIDFGAGTDTTLGDGSVLDRTGTGSNPFGSLGVVLPVDNIGAIWTGFITLPETADYRFTIRSDDGSVLFIDGVQVIDNDKLQSIANVSSSTLHLSAGPHRVKLAYFDAGGDAGMQWSWEQLTGNAPFARKVVQPQVLSCGSAPDIGAYEDPTGDDDPDGDTLSNFQECQLGTNPLSPDTDGDGFNDATEVVDGSNPLLASSVPPSTHVERVLGYGPGRGLDLSGSFLYAFNLGTTVAAGQAGDANFTTDTAPGITFGGGQNAASNWATCQFGMTAPDHVLETLFNSDRWASNDNAPSTRTLKLKLGALTVGRHYKLQLLFGDAVGHKRVFDIAVNGTVIVPGFDTSVAQGLQSPRAASAVVYEFNAPASDLNIELSGTSSPAGVDRNPLLSGVTLEGLPTAAAAPVFTTAAGNYTDSVTISIAPPVSSGATIRYTLDGTDPSETAGTLYTAAIALSSSAEVRAISVGGGWLPSTITSSSYTVQIPVSSWRAQVSLPPDGSQDMATPANDGVSNLLKFAFNMAPTQASLTVPNTTTVTPTSDSGLPDITKDPVENHLVIVFLRRKASTNSGLIYTVETGTSLTDMKPLDLSGATVESIDGTWERVTVIDPAESKERFAWVRITTT